MKTTKKTFFLIPGFKQKIGRKDFSWLISFLKSSGFRVLGVPIQWNYRTMSGYIHDFIDFYNKNKSEINYVLGFSYGAIVALAPANKLKPKKIYLCSLTPEFSEDIIKMKPWLRKLIGKKRIKDAKSRSGKKIAKELKIPSIVFYGEKEARFYPQLKVRCEETAKLAKNSKLILVKDAPHKINHKEYKRVLTQEIKHLLN